MRLLVLDERTAPDGSSWLKVLLPSRPSGSSGWIRRDGVRLHWNPLRVEVSVSERRLMLMRDGKPILRTRVVVGAAATPTPSGRFAVYEAVPRPASTLGPWALHLTGFSEVLESFAGGEGRIAIHGMSGSLLAPLGAAVSNGCIRVPAAVAAELGRLVGPGTEVVIRP